MNFLTGITNLTSWMGNVIMPTLAALFFALGVLRYAHGQAHTYAPWAGFLCLMVSGVLRGIEKFAGKCHRHCRPLQRRPGDCEQAVVGERHEAAAMNVACAVEVLLLHPERAAHAAVVLHPVPERPVVGLEIIPAPGSPARKFALRADVQIGAVEEGGFGQLVHAVRPLTCGIKFLNPIQALCANTSLTHCSGKALDS